jgi:3-polyprenyl-4-hydroxybenzoate decarboxylase
MDRYYASNMRPEPTMKVKRLYHRNNPIILRRAAYAPTLRI